MVLICIYKDSEFTENTVIYDIKLAYINFYFIW